MVRRKQSPIEDLIDLIALLPWQVPLLLAPVSYFILHYFAIQDVVVATGLEDASSVVISGLIKALATFGQIVIPVICLLGAGISWFKRRQRHSLFNDTAQGDTASKLLKLSWREFEQLVGEAYRRQNYQVQETGGHGADGGVDIILQQGGETYLVQCKQWKARQVGVQTVRELYGVMAAQGAAGGMVVTVGQFTKDAKTFAYGRNIQLINGAALVSLIGDINMSLTRNEVMESNSRPNCPKCGKAMEKRLARKGTNAGKIFWGCSAYPDCKGTLSIQS